MSDSQPFLSSNSSPILPREANQPQNENSNECQTLKSSQLRQLYLPQPLVHFRQSKESLEVHLSNTSDNTLHLNKYNSPSSQDIKTINNQLSSTDSDFSYFWNLWNCSESKKIIEALLFNAQPENWKLMRYQCEKPMENFLNLCRQKIINLPYSKQIYPGLEAVKNTIEKAIEAKSSFKNIISDEPLNDKLYVYSMNEIQSKNKREGAYYITDDGSDKKIPIGQYIAKSEIFHSHAWKDIFFKGSHLHNKATEEKGVMNEQDITQKYNKELIKTQIINNAKCIFPPQNHLCCAQFFLFNHKIYDRIVSHCPLVTGRSFSHFMREQSEVNETVKDIAGLMNSGGGVILFNCFKNYLDIEPKGEIILVSEYSKAISRIEKELKCIYPPIKMNSQVFVTFVPVARNLYSQSTLIEKILNYIEGLYIMRIVVKPTDNAPEYLYFYSFLEETKLFTIRNNERKAINPTHIHKAMKKRFNYYYIPKQDYDNEQEKNMIKKCYSLFANHGPCLAPQKGWQLIEKRPLPQNRNTSQQQLERKYKYLTLLITNSKYHHVVEQRLKAKGIDCQIIVKYNNYRFKAANNSAALFHNVKFNILLEQVAYKKQFEFDKRYMMVILVTPFLKLTERNLMSQEEFKSLDSWLKAQHKTESLRMYTFSEDDSDRYDYYLKTESKLSTMFMYFILSHYTIKCTLKNPTGYERMSDTEKSRRMKLIYPRPAP